MRYKQIPYKSGDVVLLDEQDVMKHSFNPPVQIDAAVLVLCTDGMMEIEVETNNYKLFRGDLLVCGPNRVMKPIKLLNNTAFKIIFLSHFMHRSGIGYQRSIWDKAFYLGTNPMIHLSDTQITQFEEYYRLLCEKLKNPSSSYHSEIMQSILQAMMYEILSYLDGVVVSENDRFVRQGEILFRRFVGLLAESKVKSRFVYYYADKLNVSTKYLSAVCKQVSGKTAGDIIDEFVMKDIIRMLKYSDKSIKEIALELDFPNISFFGKYVKAHLGVSPKAYRRQ
ncbi:MAG: helix-turn-helix domain-containing protein [Bacteroides sp.]|nr:helix-turn-helix domain-containing protein [Bacteroides sp.]MBR0042013.1 helix-turn-helix domain-containing protein [Bacteroides sp.]